MNIKKLYDDIKSLKVYDEESKNKILKELEVEIITNGKINTGIKTAFNRMVKSNQKRPVFQKINKTNEDTYCLCDGFKLIEWGKKEYIPKQLIPEINEDAKDCISYKKINHYDNTYDIKTGTIKIADVKKVLNFSKTKDDILPFILNNEIWIDPRYIIDILALAEYKEAEIEVKYTTEIAPITIELEKCNILILPIRPARDKEVYNKTTNIFNEIIKEEN